LKEKELTIPTKQFHELIQYFPQKTFFAMLIN